jgi:type IX secretion system substrate protein
MYRFISSKTPKESRKMIKTYTIIFLILSYISVYSQGDCAECDKFKIIGVYDFLPPPAGNNLVLLLTVTEDLENKIGGFYSDLFFVASSGDTITNRLGPSHTLPTSKSDTIPYSMVLSTELRNQDFPKDFDGKLVIQTPSLPPCVGFTVCNIPYSNVISGILETQSTNRLNIYPNPSTDIVIIETNKPIKEIKLFDINFSLVINNGNANRLDVSNLINGNYILEVTFKNRTRVYKSLFKY